MSFHKNSFLKLCTASLALLLLSGCTEVLSFGVGFGAGFFTGQYYAKDEMKQKQGMAIAASQPTATYSSTTQVYTQPQASAPLPMGGYAGSAPAYDYGAPPAYNAPTYSYSPPPAAPAAYPSYAAPTPAIPAYDPYTYSAPAPAMAPQNYSYAPAYDPYTAQLPPLAPTAPAANYAPSSPPLAGMPQQRYVPQS